jgi:hypothetical protein
MAYIGRSTDKISNIEVLDNITFDGSSSYSITKSSVAFVPNSAQSLLLSIDGVVQAGNFTVSGSTIDFGTAVAGTSTCDFVLHYGVGLITAPSDGTVTTAKLADSSVSLAKLTATGTKDATTFLRGDNTFAEAGGGKVLQVVTATDDTARSTTSTSFVTASNTLSVSITPSSTSSKVLILVSSSGKCNGNSSGFFTIYRDGTTNLGEASNGFIRTTDGNVDVSVGLGINYLDSPSTTSATTYQVYMRASANTVFLQSNTCRGVITAMEIGA